VENYIRKLTTEEVFSKTIVTELKPLEQFYPAEQYHQNYYKENGDQPYCVAVINPKVAKLRAKYASLLK
jgi:peptide-methionine (S)-S-oxide reductase